MLVQSLTTGLFDARCHVLAAGEGGDCLVVDPGAAVGAALARVLAAHRWRPAAVLLTHGHVDHTWSAGRVAAEHGVPVLVHEADAHRLPDPLAGLPGPLRDAVAAALAAEPHRVPDDVRTVVDGEHLHLAGLDVHVVHAPGHTEGSVLLRLPRPGAADLVLSGDVLFAGSVGRTDLPGGDPAAMRRTLRDRVLALDDATDVLPGHGPATTLGRERATNPHLRGLRA